MTTKEKRLKVQSMLETFGYPVYANKPREGENGDHIIYHQLNESTKNADNIKYLKYAIFQISFYHKRLDTEVDIGSLFPYSTLNSKYDSDSFYNDVYTIKI